MLKVLIFAILMISTQMVASLAFADQMGPGGDKFYEEAARFENACANKVVCDPPYSKKIAYDQTRRYEKLTREQKLDLKDVAYYQAQIWGDTILEGDYHAAGRTRLDFVQAFYKNDQVVGYKIDYSEKAWYIGNCSFDGTRVTLKDCTQGRIIEGSYVSPDMQTYFRDEDRFANFTPITR